MAKKPQDRSKPTTKAPRATKATAPAPSGPPTEAPRAPAPPPPPPPAVPVPGTKVPGVRDSQLHATLHEAHRVLSAGKDAFGKVIDQCEGQFVRPLLNAHDGDSEACVEIKRQIAAFRGLYR